MNCTHQLFGSIGVLTLTCGLVALPLRPVQSAPATPKGWVRIKTEPDQKTWFVDTGSISGKGRYRYFWSYAAEGAPYPDPEAAGQLVYSTALYLSVDCQQKQFRLRYTQLFDQSNKAIKEFDYGDSLPLGSALPGSGEEAALKYVCSRRR